MHPMLQRLASDSGGRALALDQAAQLTGALDRISADLFNRYRVQAPLPTGVAGSDLSVQIATPTGVSEIMPVSFAQPAKDGQAAAATGDQQVAAAADPQAAAPPVVMATPVATPFVTGNLLAVIGLSTIPLSGVLIVGFTTVQARRRPNRAHASAAVVSDEVGDEVLATRQALDGSGPALDDSDPADGE